MASLAEVYGKDFNKKKKKSKKKLKQPICNYYARQYKKAEEDEPYTIQSNDRVNNYADYEQHSADFTGRRNKYAESNREEPRDQKLYVDVDEETDYFDKLYKTHEFKALENTDGSNFMGYQKNDDDDDDDDDEREYIDRNIKTDTLGLPNDHIRRTRPLYEVGTPEYQEDKNYLDFGLFLISGVLLIFILEQFVQLGMILKEKRERPAVHYE